MAPVGAVIVPAAGFSGVGASARLDTVPGFSGFEAATPLGFAYDPVTAFLPVATVIVLVVVLVYLMCNLACIGLFTRRRREDLVPVLYVPVPALGILAFVPALRTGVAYLLCLLARQPGRVRQTSQVHPVDELDAHEREVAG